MTMFSLMHCSDCAIIWFSLVTVVVYPVQFQEVFNVLCNYVEQCDTEAGRYRPQSIIFSRYIPPMNYVSFALLPEVRMFTMITPSVAGHITLVSVISL